MKFKNKNLIVPTNTCVLILLLFINLVSATNIEPETPYGTIPEILVGISTTGCEFNYIQEAIAFVES